MWSKYLAIYMPPNWCFGMEIFQGSPEPVYTRKLTTNNSFTLFVIIEFSLRVLIVFIVENSFFRKFLLLPKRERKEWIP